MFRFTRASLALFPLLLAGPSLAATPFDIETVVGDGYPWYNSLAMDSEGTLHLAFQLNGTMDLMYGTRRNGEWTIGAVDTTGSVGSYAFLALDAEGRPHIAYGDASTPALRFAELIDGAWITEIVDDSGNVGSRVSLDLDADGNPHISYFDFTNGNCKYAVRSAGVWTLETIDAVGFGAAATSLEVDQHGDPHITYFDTTNEVLRYAVKASGLWDLEPIDETGNARPFHSLALDPQGRPCVVYGATFSNFRYAVLGASGWVLEDVALAEAPSAGFSLAIDSWGHPHATVGVGSPGSAGAVYATKAGSSWEVETLAGDGRAVYYASTLIDPQGNPIISFADHTSDELRVADSAVHLDGPMGGERWDRSGRALVTWRGVGTVDIDLSTAPGETIRLASGVSGGELVVDVPAVTSNEARVTITRIEPFSSSSSPEPFEIGPRVEQPWAAGVVDSDGAPGYWPSLALDANDESHVAYYDNEVFDLRYARKLDGIWAVETVDSTGITGRWPSLAIDANGEPRISYVDITDFDLEVAVKSDGAWTIEKVDETGQVGRYSSLAIDAMGRTHVSYRDDTNDALKYAVDSAGWVVETVDADADPSETSLALDRDGNPHIAYNASVPDLLLYARNTTGSWVVDTVDVAGVVGPALSLALDANDHPVISYGDATESQLRLATWNGDAWQVEVVDTDAGTGQENSLALAPDGTPHISYLETINDDLRYATRRGGIWTTTTLDEDGLVGFYNSLVVDGDGNPRIAYYDGTDSALRYLSPAIENVRPAGGAVWPVGATRAITWDGPGPVDLSLSVDGGATFLELARRVDGGSYELRVPHRPSRFCLVRVDRPDQDVGAVLLPGSSQASDSLFTIETSIELLALRVVEASDAPGLLVSWSTDPGPDDLRGYRLEKLTRQGELLVLAAETPETSHHDPGGRAGDRYRLHAVNGLGETLYLGEVSPGTAPSVLRVVPHPYRGGSLRIEIPIVAGGSHRDAEIAIYDVSGRRVRRLDAVPLDDAVYGAEWDGTGADGRPVSSGIYFVRSHAGSAISSARLVVAR